MLRKELALDSPVLKAAAEAGWHLPYCQYASAVWQLTPRRLQDNEEMSVLSGVNKSTDFSGGFLGI